MEAQDETIERIANEEQTVTNHHPAPTSTPDSVSVPATRKQPADGHAVWYLVGATFLFAGAAFAFTLDQSVVGIVGLVVGAVVAGAGVWAWRRAHVANHAPAAPAAPPTGPQHPRL